jgi:hypothetical protein
LGLLRDYSNRLGGLRSLWARVDVTQLVALLDDVTAIHSEWIEAADQQLDTLFRRHVTVNVSGQRIKLPFNDRDDVTPDNWPTFKQYLDKIMSQLD